MSEPDTTGKLTDMGVDLDMDIDMETYTNTDMDTGKHNVFPL